MNTQKLAKDMQKALDVMKAERDDLDTNIEKMEKALSAFDTNGIRSRGQLGTPAKRGPGRPKGSKNKNWSASKRKAVSDRMKKYWAERRKAEAKNG